MVSGEKGIVMDEFETNSEWDVLDTSYRVDWESGEASVIFSIKLKRKPLYVLLSVIMPIIMLAVLNIFVFVLPCESGEKASYAITVFLAFAVFLTIISSTFPENSEVVAIFSIYLIIQTLQSTLISLVALVLVRCSSFDEKETPVPGCLQGMLSIVSCNPCRKRRSKNKIEDSEADLKAIKKLNGKNGDRIVSVRKRRDSADSDTDLFYDYSWKEVVNMLDRLFFAFFTLVLVVSTLVFFIVTATQG